MNKLIIISLSMIATAIFLAVIFFLSITPTVIPGHIVGILEKFQLLIPVLVIIGVITSIIGFISIRKSQVKISWWSWFSIIISCLLLVMLVIFLGIVFSGDSGDFLRQ